MRLKQSVWGKAKQVTFCFEGRGYTQISGDFDGMGMSLGALQWNFGMGTLQPLFNRLFAEYPDTVLSILPDGGQWLKLAIDNGTAVDWARQIQINNRVVDPWYSALVSLCNTPEFQGIQDDAMGWYRDKAIEMCTGFGLNTDRAFCLMFDIAVQNGGIPYYELAEPTYIQKLEAVANAAVRRSLAQWQPDVGKRKLAIVYSKDLGRGWCGVEFDDECAFEDETIIEAEEITMEEVKEMTVDEAIQVFVDNGIISSPEYWINAYQVVNNLDSLLIKTAKVLKG